MRMRRWLILWLGGVDKDAAVQMSLRMFRQVYQFLLQRRAHLREALDGYAIPLDMQGRLDELDVIIEAMENVEIVEGEDA